VVNDLPRDNLPRDRFLAYNKKKRRAFTAGLFSYYLKN
jgi:hypothetical protein